MGLNDSIVTYKAILNDFMQSFVYINIKLSTFEISSIKWFDYIVKYIFISNTSPNIADLINGLVLMSSK